MKKEYTFPDGFLWGTATSAHQIEGNNANSDWWEWEQNKKPGQQLPTEPSGIACDSYLRYEEDLDLCVALNNQAVRFSVEWARIEPEEGVFDEDAINHYRRVIEAANHRHLKIFLTLHHFTNPVWVKNKGGWANPQIPWFFARYAKKCAESFGNTVECYLTLNEPQAYAYMAYLEGTWPPQVKNIFVAFWVQINLILGHRMAYDAIKSLSKAYQVGLVKHIVWFQSGNGKFKFIDDIATKIMFFLGCDTFLTPIMDKLDVIGLNYYFTNRIENLKRANLDDVLSDLNWWVWPDGLAKTLVQLKKFKKPIYITENGIADAGDKLRVNFLKNMIKSAHSALEQGVDLRGYFYWSLIDNYEWHSGFWPRFGLVEIDRNNNLARKPRKSFYYYGTISKENKLTVFD